MDVPFNAEVQCTDGTCGRSTHVIFDPQSNAITHLVVKEEGLLGDERLVPIDFTLEGTPDRIQLRCTKDEMKSMTPFVRNQYIQPNKLGDESPGSDFLLVPGLAVHATPIRPIAVKVEQTPEGELSLARGLPVHALDGMIGHVSEFLMDPASHKITHLVIEEGHFWDKKHHTIAVTEIDHVDKDAVYLRITKDIVEALAAV